MTHPSSGRSAAEDGGGETFLARARNGRSPGEESLTAAVAAQAIEAQPSFGQIKPSEAAWFARPTALRRRRGGYRVTRTRGRRDRAKQKKAWRSNGRPLHVQPPAAQRPMRIVSRPMEATPRSDRSDATTAMVIRDRLQLPLKSGTAEAQPCLGGDVRGSGGITPAAMPCPASGAGQRASCAPRPWPPRRSRPPLPLPVSNSRLGCRCARGRVRHDIRRRQLARRRAARSLRE